MVLTDTVEGKRQEWIDVSKGAGIVLVVVAHAMIPMQGNVYLYSFISFMTSFVMPIYFILAGLTYNGDKHRGDLKNYAISRGKQLLIPYFAIYIIMMLLYIPLTGSIDTYLTPADLVFWLLYGAGPPGQPTYLWFLPVLYFGLVLFTVIELATHNQDPRVRWPFVVLFPFLGLWITDVFSPMLVPWRVNHVFFTAAFCIIGHEMKRYLGFRQWRTASKILDGVIIVILFAIILPISQYNGFVSAADDWFGVSGWLFFLTGILGTLFIFMLSSISESSAISRTMQYFGVHSQVIFEIHPIFFYLVPITLGLLGVSATVYDTQFVLFWPVRFIFAFGLSILFTFVVYRNRILSVIFTGKSNK
jgi:fucose 4-O-acetylase-like acetyltransferase